MPTPLHAPIPKDWAGQLTARSHLTACGQRALDGWWRLLAILGHRVALRKGLRSSESSSAICASSFSSVGSTAMRAGEIRYKRPQEDENRNEAIQSGNDDAEPIKPADEPAKVRVGRGGAVGGTAFSRSRGDARAGGAAQRRHRARAGESVWRVPTIPRRAGSGAACLPRHMPVGEDVAAVAMGWATDAALDLYPILDIGIDIAAARMELRHTRRYPAAGDPSDAR